MRPRYVLRCNTCGAPAADTVRLCPYCGKATGFEGLGGAGLRRSRDGGMEVRAGGGVVVGAAPREQRECPFCGTSVLAEEKRCSHCRTKIVIEVLRVATLTVQGGTLRVHAGARFEVIGKRKLPIHDAATKDDAAEIRVAIEGGDDPNHPDPKGDRPLHYAAQRGATNAMRALIAAGAGIDATNDRMQTCLHLAARAGREAAVELLLMVGADRRLRDERGLTPAELARNHQHHRIAEMLA